MTPYELWVDLTPDGAAPEKLIHCSQDDIGRPFLAHLLYLGEEYDMPSGTTVEIHVMKPDGNYVIASAVCSGSTIYFELEEQMAVVQGNCRSEFVFYPPDGERLGTKNFYLVVEPGAIDGGTPSESELSWLQETENNARDAREAAASAAESAEDASGILDSFTEVVAHQVEQMQVIPGQVVIDGTLTVQGAAADAKKTGDELANLSSAIEQIEPGLSAEAKVALLNCFAHVAWLDANGKDYYDTLEQALYQDRLVSISAVFTQGSVVIYPSTPLNDLKAYLVVTGYYGDGTSEIITDYTLSGQLVVGISTITVAFDDKTDSFDVLVTSARRPELPSEYNQVEYIYGDGTQWTTLDILSQIPFEVNARILHTQYESNVFNGDNGTVGLSANFRFLGFGHYADQGAKNHGVRVGSNGWTYTSGHDANEIVNIKSGVYVSSNKTYAYIQVNDDETVEEQLANSPVIGYPMHIFKRDGDSWMGRGVRFYSLVCYAGGQVKIFDGIPCSRKSDGVGGLYDTVSNTFYPSEGSSNFILGSVIE